MFTEQCSFLQIRDKMKIDFIVKAYVTGVVTPKSAKSKKDVDGPSMSSSSKVIERSGIEIQSVLDVLPHLEIAFVQKLLLRYDNTELAIAAVLEGNLPPDLMGTDSTTADNESNEPIERHTKVVERFTSGPEDREIVNVKIKSQIVRPKAEKRFLDDKSSIKEFHARNIEHGYVDEPDEYDDEYDDSYEAMVDSESRTMSILKKTGAINELVDEVDDSESESGDETTESNARRDGSRDFCENPELVRERWARNRDAKYANKRPPKPSG